MFWNINDITLPSYTCLAEPFSTNQNHNHHAIEHDNGINVDKESMIDLPPWNLVRHKCMDSCGMLRQLIGNGCPSLGNIGNFSGERPGGWFFRDLWLCHWVWRDVGPPSELQGCSTTVFWGLKFRIKRINTPRNAEQVKLVWFYINISIFELSYLRCFDFVIIGSCIFSFSTEYVNT